MAYHLRKTLFHTSFPAFVEQLAAELYKEGFTILASSDIEKILKESLQINMRKYRIISVIIPHLFNEMLSLHLFTGFVLPCQITVYEKTEHEVELSIVDPTRFMAETVSDSSLQNLADETGRRLNAVLELLSDRPVGAPDGLV